CTPTCKRTTETRAKTSKRSLGGGSTWRSPSAPTACARSPARMQAYVEARRAEKAADQTIKNEIAVLRRMLRLGYKHPKVAQLPSFPEIAVQNTRATFFENDEYERLLAALATLVTEGRDVGNDWLVPFVIVARWTGARRDELLTLERRQLDLET